MIIGSSDAPRTRRRFLRLGGTAAAGAAAGAFIRGGTASAADNDPVLVGHTVSGTTTTGISSPISGGSTFFAENTDGTGAGVEGDGFVGVYGFGSTVDSYGVLVDGAFSFVANLSAPPTEGVWARGDIIGSIDDDSVWYCTASGDGAQSAWVKIAGPGAAGAFHAVSPTRVYDSRTPAPQPGRLVSGGNRVVSVADGRDLDSGAVIAAGLVPPGATAITYNLVAVGTAPPPGFLAVTPGDAATFAASTINWSGPITIANGGTVKLDASRQVKVFLGGAPGANADFLIDVTGYYR